MPLLRYEADLRSLEPKERERVEGILDDWAYTGVMITSVPFIVQFFLDEKEDIERIPGLPMSLIHRIA